MDNVRGHQDTVVRCMKTSFPEFCVDTTYHRLATGLVFHTWSAVNKRGIPDGSYPISGVYLDCVYKIKAQAKQLEADGIPVMIVYSRLNLPRLDETKMIFAFRKENNIVLLCLEDMPDVIPTSCYTGPYLPADMYIMLPRIVIAHAEAVRYRLWQTACNLGKEQYALSLVSNGGNAIMYLDIDMVFTTTDVPVIYAKDGICTWPELNVLFTHENCKPGTVDSTATKAIKKHAEVFQRGWQSIMQYVATGDAYNNANRITDARNKQKRKYSYPAIAIGYPSMIVVEYSSVAKYKTLTNVAPGLDVSDFHTDPVYRYVGTGDVSFRENHTFIYLQLLPYMKRDRAMSWSPLEM